MAASEEARRRIVEAAAELHATHGGVATSHAMIAEKAGVSIPTVYKYFPTANDLIPACTGLVAGRAPVALDETIFQGLDRVPDRVAALARALFRFHEYLAPWARWTPTDAERLPALKAFVEGGRKAQLALLRRALTPARGKAPAESFVLLCQVLLDFPSWRTLTSTGQSTEAAAVAVTDAILALERSRHEHARR